jgi:hypothetical protein
MPNYNIYIFIYVYIYYIMTTSPSSVLLQYNAILNVYKLEANSYSSLITIIDNDLTLSEKDDNYTLYITTITNAITVINGLQQYNISAVNYDLTQNMQINLNTLSRNFTIIDINFTLLNTYYKNKLISNFRALQPRYTQINNTLSVNSTISELLYDSDKWSIVDLTDYPDINYIYYPSIYSDYSGNFNTLMLNLNNQYTLDYKFSKTIKEVFNGETSTDPKYIDINIYNNIWETSIKDIDNTLKEYLKPNTIDKTTNTTMGPYNYITGYFYTKNILDQTTDLINTSLTLGSGTDTIAQLTKLNNSINHLNKVNNKIADLLKKIKDTAKIIANASDGIIGSTDIYTNYISTCETSFVKTDLNSPFNSGNEYTISKFYKNNNIVKDYKRIIIYLFYAYFSAEPSNKKTALQAALSEIINSKFSMTSRSQDYKLNIDGKSNIMSVKNSAKTKTYIPILDVWFNPTQAAPPLYATYPTISTNSYYSQYDADPLKNNNTFHNQKFMWDLADPSANLTLFLQTASTSSTYEDMYTSVSTDLTDITGSYPYMNDMVYIKKSPTTTNTSNGNKETLTYTKCIHANPVTYYITTRTDKTDGTTTISTVASDAATYDAAAYNQTTARDIVTKPVEFNGAVNYTHDILYEFNNYTSTNNYNAGSLNEYWNAAMCYVGSAQAGTGTIVNVSVAKWLIHSNAKHIASNFPKLLTVMDAVATNEKKLFVPLIKLLNYYLSDNKYEILGYTDHNLTYKNTLSGEIQKLKVNPTLKTDTTNTNYYDISMEDIILMLKMVYINKNDSTIQSQNLHKNISNELTNILNISYVSIGSFIDTSNNTTKNLYNIGGIIETLLFGDISNTIENANKLTIKSIVANAYKVKSNETYLTYKAYSQIKSNSSYKLNEVTVSNYKIYIKLRRPNKSGYEDDAYYCNITTETAITNDPISEIAYLTLDYTATGTRLQTYTVEDLNKALQAAFRRLKCYYIDSRPTTDPSTDQDYDLYTVRDEETTGQLFSYFAYFVPYDGETPYKLITKCIGHDSTGSGYLTKPDGWIYTPHKVYNPVITLNCNPDGISQGKSDGLLQFYIKKDIKTIIKNTAGSRNYLKTVRTVSLKNSDGSLPIGISYTNFLPHTTFGTHPEPATTTENIITTSTVYRSISTDENYNEKGTNMIINSPLKQSSIDDYIEDASTANKATMDATLTQMKAYQNTMVNCSIISSEIEFATGIKRIDSDFCFIKETLTTALTGTANDLVDEALTGLDTFYDAYTAIPAGKTTNIITDATKVLERYYPITTLETSRYITDIFDTTETTVNTTITTETAEIEFKDRIKDRCDEMKRLADNFYSLSTSIKETVNQHITYLIDYLVNETNIMKVDIGNKYNSLPDTDPIKQSALIVKNRVDGYYTTSSSLAASFITSTTQRMDLTIIKNNFENTLTVEEPLMDSYLKTSIDTIVTSMQTIQSDVNATYTAIANQSPANTNLTAAATLNDTVNTNVTDTLAIQSGWSASITKLADFLEAKNNYASVQLDKEQINLYV